MFFIWVLILHLVRVVQKVNRTILWINSTQFQFLGIEGDGSLPPLDGFNVWHSISEGTASPRTEILHNIDLSPSKSDFPKFNTPDYEGIALRVDDMKLLMNVPNLTWYKPPELLPHLTNEVRKVRRVCFRNILLPFFVIYLTPTEFIRSEIFP